MFLTATVLMLTVPAAAKETKVHDALEWVNRTRAQKGLPPFKRDEKLSQAAKAAAKFRAERGIEGHTSNDFSFVPQGGHAASAGCAAWPLNGPFGKMWGSCCSEDNYRYAGAAWAKGHRNKRYMHLFVR